MPTSPVAVDVLPPAPNPDSDEAIFDNVAWTWSSALPNFRAQMNAITSVTYTNAQEAVAAASAAATSASSAVSQAGIATTQAGIATTKAGEAAASASTASTAAGAASSSAGAAAASAAAAAALAGAFVGTSTSSLAIGLGSRTFATQAGEAYTPGIFMTAVSAANGSNWMYFQVTSYSGTTLLTNVLAFGGGGTFADWNLSLAGVPGAQGPKGDTGATGGLAGGALTAHLSELKAPNITAASATNVWAAIGNSATLIGTTPITGWGAAPQAGDKFTLIAGAVTPLTHGANSQLPGGVNYTTAVGDRLEIYAETATQMRVSIFKADGRAVAASGITTVGAVITTDATLTAASAGYQPIQMAALGKSVGLPNATTLGVGGPLFTLDNSKGTFPVGIRDGAGTLISAVAPGGQALVSLRDNSTAAGVWSVVGNGLEPGLLTVAYSTTTFVNAGNSQPSAFVALDGNVSIHFFYWSTNSFYAVVVDNVGKVLSTPVTVTALGGPVLAAFKISATQAIVFFGTSGTDHSAVVLTLTGSTPSYALNVGTSANSSAFLGAAWGGEDSRSDPRIAQLTSNLYLVAGRNGSNDAVAIAVSVSGSTITVGSVTTPIATLAGATTIYPLTATTALLILTTGSSAPLSVSAYVLSVSGTTVTWSAAASLGTYSATFNSTCSSVLLSPTRAVVMINNNNNLTGVAVAMTISGTSIAVGSPVSLFSIGSGVLDISYTGGRAGRYSPRLWAIDANTFGAWVLDPSASGASLVKIATVSGTTINPGNAANKTIAIQTSGNGVGYGVLLPPGGTELLALRQTLSDAAGYRLQVVPAKISGTAVAAGISEPVPDAFQTSPGLFAMGKTSSGDYALLPQGVSGTANAVAGPSKVVIVRSTGDRAIVRGSISIPELYLPSATPPHRLANVAPNRFVLVGGAVGGYSGGTVIDALQVLNVEIAA